MVLSGYYNILNYRLLKTYVVSKEKNNSNSKSKIKDLEVKCTFENGMIEILKNFSIIEA